MWHQARKQEKKLRCLMVDYKKRAERRRTYYELCKKDPCSFLRLQGSNMRIHIDPAVASAAEGPRSMMAWNGEEDNLIDRFDVRAHMDYIPECKPGSSLPDALEVEDDMRCNYDRYRIIVQNDCANICEEAALKQIDLDERFGDVSKHNVQEDKKKSLASKKAAIAFSYDDSEEVSLKSSADKELSADEEEEDFEDVDLDIAFDIDEITPDMKQLLDIVAITYGMSIGEFAEQLTKDKEDERELREAKIAEQEKAAMSGRKSRKERRLYKETMLRLRGASPPRYHPPDQATRGSPTYGQRSRMDSDSSRSPSPVADNLEFITNLDEDVDTEQPAEKISESSLPPHLRLGRTSSTASWKQRRMRSESPVLESTNRELTNQICRKQLSPPPPVIKSYRRVSLEKSDNYSDASSDEDGTTRRQSSYKSAGDSGKGMSKSYAAAKPSQAAGGKMTAQERLKRKMKSAINKTYKEDKKTIEEKRDQMRKEQQQRADEIRHQAEEMRKKDFSKLNYSSSSSRSRSKSRERSVERRPRDHHSNRLKDRPSASDSTGRGGYRPSSKDYDRDRNSHRHSRESRDRYRDSHHSSGRRSYSRSPTRRRNYR